MSLSATIDEHATRTLGESAAGWLTALCVGAMFLISGLMLHTMGIAYDTAGGALWQKIHPASYLAIVAVLVMAFARLRPIAFLDDVVRWHKGTILFVALWFLLLLHIGMFVHAPLASIVDTFLLPAVLLILLTRISANQASSLAVLIHAAMTVNALIAVFEFVSGARLTPLVAEGVTLVADWRSSALLGHPLQNALITATYTLIMLQGGGRDLPPVLRTIIIMLQFAALITFGGRVAALLLIGFGGVAVAMHAWKSMRLRQLTQANAAVFVGLATLTAVALILMASSGFFDLFIKRFAQDQGSADARVAMFHLLDQMPFFAFLFGSDPEHVATLQRLDGIEFGIESFWVAFVAFYGIVISIPFFAGLLAFLFDLKRASRAPSGWAIFFFIAVCSTSLSLAGKTTAFGMVTAMVLLLLRHEPERET